MIRLCTVLFLLYAATNAAVGQASLNGIIFNEVLPKPNISSTSGFDTDGDGVFERDDEFIEFVNNGTANVDLNGYEIYDAAGLKLTIPGSLVVAPGEFIVIIFDYDGTVPAGYFDISDGSSISVINDGSEGLYLCNPASGEYIGLVYGGRTVTNPTVCTTNLGVEDFGSPTEGLSIQRVQRGTTTEVITPTPLATNGQAVVATSTAEGWRLLSAPLDGLTVSDVLPLNLVRGVGTEYPTDPPNLFLSYDGNQTPGGNDGYAPATALTDVLEPGAGFWWYFFDAASPPTLTGGGTSVVGQLPIALTAPGTSLAANKTVRFVGRDPNDGFYIAGNPFTESFNLSGVSVAPVTGVDPLVIQDVVSIWDAAANAGVGGYVSYSRTGAGGNPQVVAPWQGYWIEVLVAGLLTPPVGIAIDVTYDVAQQTTGGSFVGRQAALEERYIRFELATAAEDGRPIANPITLLFTDGASEGWDVFDASSLGSFAVPYAFAAFLGDRAGETRWKVQESLPLNPGKVVSIPLAYASFGTASSFELRWPVLENVPEVWRVELVDTVTGARVDVRTASRYAFEQAEGEPAERFVIEVDATANPVAAEGPTLPNQLELSAVHPNPTTAQASVRLSTPTAEPVQATVYDVLGRTVRVVFDGQTGPGTPTQVSFATNDLPAGTYVLQVVGQTFSEARRFMVVR